MLSLNAIGYKIDDKHVLNNLTLSLQDNDHLLIHGPSGCGKSTLMHIMAGLLKATSGTISFNKANYSDLSAQQIDKMRGENFGFVFQKINLIGHLTAKQNIELAGNINTAITDDLGLTNLLDQKASSLSIGERQRIAIARAVANNPAIIFADEPTSALDQANADKVMDTLFDQAEKHGSSLIVTSHDNRILTRFKNKLDLNKCLI